MVICKPIDAAALSSTALRSTKMKTKKIEQVPRQSVTDLTPEMLDYLISAFDTEMNTPPTVFDILLAVAVLIEPKCKAQFAVVKQLVLHRELIQLLQNFDKNDMTEYAKLRLHKFLKGNVNPTMDPKLDALYPGLTVLYDLVTGVDMYHTSLRHHALRMQMRAAAGQVDSSGKENVMPPSTRGDENTFHVDLTETIKQKGLVVTQTPLLATSVINTDVMTCPSPSNSTCLPTTNALSCIPADGAMIDSTLKTYERESPEEESLGLLLQYPADSLLSCAQPPSPHQFPSKTPVTPTLTDATPITHAHVNVSENTLQGCSSFDLTALSTTLVSPSLPSPPDTKTQPVSVCEESSYQAEAHYVIHFDALEQKFQNVKDLRLSNIHSSLGASSPLDSSDNSACPVVSCSLRAPRKGGMRRTGNPCKRNRVHFGDDRVIPFQNSEELACRSTVFWGAIQAKMREAYKQQSKYREEMSSAEWWWAWSEEYDEQEDKLVAPRVWDFVFDRDPAAAYQSTFGNRCYTAPS